MRTTYIELIFVIACLFLVSCSNKNFVVYNAVKGSVISSKDHKPIKEVKIYVKKGSSNDFGIVSTNEKGIFLTEGLELPYKYLHDQRNLSFNYYIEKTGYIKKVIYIKNLKETKNNKLDTINLGEVYLDPED